MDMQNEKVSPKEDDVSVPESPKPLAFTIDFGGGKVDVDRHKTLMEKYQKKHRRGQSLSKIEDVSINSTVKKRPSTGNLPRKASFQSEGYYSSDEKNERNKQFQKPNNGKLRDGLTLPLKNVTMDKMTLSYPNCSLPSISSPEVELNDISSPELDLISPYSPRLQIPVMTSLSTVSPTVSPNTAKPKVLRQYSSPECETRINIEEQFTEGIDFDFDKSDNVSDAGTYTLDADNYSEEQKARMSIDREFKIESISVLKKTEEYIQSLANININAKDSIERTVHKIHETNSSDNFTNPALTKEKVNLDYQIDIDKNQSFTQTFAQVKKISTHRNAEQSIKMLSPILSPTQNLSIIQSVEERKGTPEVKEDINQKTFSKIMLPSSKTNTTNCQDQGNVISVTSSGAFRPKSEKERTLARKLSLTKSEVQVEAYTDNNYIPNGNFTHTAVNRQTKPVLTSNLVLVGESVPSKNNEITHAQTAFVQGKISNLPPPIGGISGKNSPTKIPSPIHTVKPRSHNSNSSLNIDLSDSSLETESYLKPTQNYINSLQQRLSLDSDNEYETKFLNNDHRNLIKQKPTHVRHNSFDDRSLKSNKLEHFKNKNLLIDQTSNVFNQYQKVHKIQNSPNNSPIRRSSSFSTKNQITQQKFSNVQKETNLCNSPNFTRNGSIQRSASTASIKPNLMQYRGTSTSDHQKIDRNQFGDTESSSEEDFEKNHVKKKDIMNTRYNRAFSLRRARLEEPAPTSQALKCPNTPEMRRKFQPNERCDRAISVDRKQIKTTDVQSRYLQNITRTKTTPAPKPETKIVPKHGQAKSANRSQGFSRTDTGRFSMRTNKPGTQVLQKPLKKDSSGKKQSGTRSNSSLSSREVEFQNWKRRKSYDPMKAAAEGKKKADMAKKQIQSSMTQSYNESQNQEYDSSPSHSSSVHRSQSFHGTAALEQLMSSEEDDLTLSADEGFSPPTPSPCELSPTRASLRYTWKDRLRH